MPSESWSIYQGSHFNEPWLLSLPVHGKVLNSLTWVIVSWISSVEIWGWQQVYSRHFPKRKTRSKISTYETLTAVLNTPGMILLMKQPGHCSLFPQDCGMDFDSGGLYWGTTADSMLELVLWLAFCCHCDYNHTLWTASEDSTLQPDC